MTSFNTRHCSGSGLVRLERRGTSALSEQRAEELLNTNDK